MTGQVEYPPLRFDAPPTRDNETPHAWDEGLASILGHCELLVAGENWYGDSAAVRDGLAVVEFSHVGTGAEHYRSVALRVEAIDTHPRAALASADLARVCATSLEQEHAELREYLTRELGEARADDNKRRTAAFADVLAWLDAYPHGEETPR
jgi:hypothetical protein